MNFQQEWDSTGLGDTGTVIELYETVTNSGNDTRTPKVPPIVVVRAEEALIVILVLVLWVAAIVLFFNRWGKIRMLEPYQPKFQQQQHRPSCPMIDVPLQATQRSSFSKFNMNFVDPAMFPTVSIHGIQGMTPSAVHTNRPRQNSVFVGSAASVTFLPQNPPRKTRSAVDIHTLVLSECSPTSEGSSTQLQGSCIGLQGCSTVAPQGSCIGLQGCSTGATQGSCIGLQGCSTGATQGSCIGLQGCSTGATQGSFIGLQGCSTGSTALQSSSFQGPSSSGLQGPSIGLQTLYSGATLSPERFRISPRRPSSVVAAHV